jgi:flavin reductase (DIM6/NTAB) family NADH-FMN oxidoreductase RutF
MQPLAKKRPDAYSRTAPRLAEKTRIARSLDNLAQAGISEIFRLAMRELAGGVSVVTAGEGKRRAGFTATSVTSLSVTPPALLICVQQTSGTLATILENGCFAVNLLSGQQREIAHRFSGRSGVQGADRFSGHDWRYGKLGVPVLDSALAAVECTVAQVTEWHTHSVIFANVAAVAVRGEGDSLTYWRGDYAALNGQG